MVLLRSGPNEILYAHIVRHARFSTATKCVPKAASETRLKIRYPSSSLADTKTSNELERRTGGGNPENDWVVVSFSSACCSLVLWLWQLCVRAAVCVCDEFVKPLVAFYAKSSAALSPCLVRLADDVPMCMAWEKRLSSADRRPVNTGLFALNPFVRCTLRSPNSIHQYFNGSGAAREGFVCGAAAQRQSRVCVWWRWFEFLPAEQSRFGMLRREEK